MKTALKILGGLVGLLVLLAGGFFVYVQTTWSLDRPGMTSGFVPEHIAPELDFISVHLYPETGKLDEAVATLRGFDVGKPVAIEETFPLKCSAEDLRVFLAKSRAIADGWIGFYWGKRISDYQASGSLAAAITASWLELFQAGPESF